MKKFIFLALLFFLIASSSFAGTIQLPQTGQTKCYDTSGTEIACAGTGQDGEIRAGVAWPNPRFSDNGDGTLTDRLTGLIWLKDANCFGQQSWTGSLDKIADFNAHPGNYSCLNYTASYADWRLPNIIEIESLINPEAPSPYTWLNSKGFLNVQYNWYWSSTSRAYTVSIPSADSAWTVSMMAGWVNSLAKEPGEGIYLWPVRAGQFGAANSSYPANLWKTGQKTSYYSGDDGSIQAGVSWPSDRFTDIGDGTVADNLTGLVWTKNSSTPLLDACPVGTMPWQEALDLIACLNANSYLGYKDWRLPNRKELFSLIDYSQSYPALPNGHPFTNINIMSNNRYWASTSAGAYENTVAWLVDVVDEGGIGGTYKSVGVDYQVWPVRGGGSTPPPPPTCMYTYSDWGTCQPDNTQTRTVLSAMPDGCTGTPMLSQSCTPPTRPKLEVSPSSYDFGETTVGICSTLQLFTLKNTGNADLNVSGISLTDPTNFHLDSTIIYACSTNGQTIKPGDFCNVVISFCPSTSGSFNENLTVKSNDLDTSTLNVQLTGSAKKLCDPPNNVYTDNSKASGLFEGNAEIKEKGDTTTVDINIQGTDIFAIKGGSIDLWATIDDISFDSSCVISFGSVPKEDDFVGYTYAEKRIIAPGTHAAFQASFCKPSTITFELGVANQRAVAYTMADIYLTAFGVPVTEIDTFVNDISNPADFPSINSAMVHIKNAMDLASERKTGKALKEIILAGGDIRKLASDKNQLIKLQLEFTKFGIEVGIPKLILGTLSFATKVVKLLTDIIVYNVQTGFSAKAIQIIVVAN